jgi:3-phosphoshikimate 1-carboxyvinyltransferase
MTREMIPCFPQDGGTFPIEPDASSGSYFWAANELLRQQNAPGPGIQIANRPTSAWQVDARFPDFIPLPAEISRQHDLADSILTAMILAPFAARPVRFTELGRLRVQECERVVAMRTELTRCGARVIETGDTLVIYPSALHGAEIETYDDHRIAMCFGTLGLRVPEVRLKNPACVRKTFPNFFQKLAVAPPHGLGARILNADTRVAVPLGELLAEDS